MLFFAVCRSASLSAIISLKFEELHQHFLRCSSAGNRFPLILSEIVFILSRFLKDILNLEQHAKLSHDFFSFQNLKMAPTVFLASIVTEEMLAIIHCCFSICNASFFSDNFGNFILDNKQSDCSVWFSLYSSYFGLTDFLKLEVEFSS